MPAPDAEAIRTIGEVLSLDHERNTPGNRCFAAPPEIEAGDKARFLTVQVPISVWAEMGSPERITIRVEAGETLED